jgi:hypothetical protein
MATKSENRPAISRRSFLKGTLLGTGALALSQPLFERSAYATTGPITLTYWHGWTGEWEKMVKFVVDMYCPHVPRQTRPDTNQPGGCSLDPIRA